MKYEMDFVFNEIKYKYTNKYYTACILINAHLCYFYLDSDRVHFQKVIDEASDMLRRKYNIVHSTVQVEDYQQVMDLCQVCQTVPSAGMRWMPCWS